MVTLGSKTYIKHEKKYEEIESLKEQYFVKFYYQTVRFLYYACEGTVRVAIVTSGSKTYIKHKNFITKTVYTFLYYACKGTETHQHVDVLKNRLTGRATKHHKGRGVL